MFDITTLFIAPIQLLSQSTTARGAFDADGNQIELDQTLVDAAAAEIAAELAATEYQRQRAPEYPSLATLADALYWNSTGDSTKLDEYYAACAAVKAKYPKGGDS
jgi:hypothetical protein